MINIYECEALVKIYCSLDKRCNIIDKFINNHAYYCGSYGEEYSAVDVYNDILDLIERKNQLINIKLMIDNAVNKLSINDKKVLYVKLNYNISMQELCSLLDVKERTAFRRIEHAFENMAEIINHSKYCAKLENIIDKQEWIKKICGDVKQRRLAFKSVQPSHEFAVNNQ